eukprot:GHUV01020357.1.p1 GENE.GHUV01020357.1~~GHUV01020357.1.p1  ORF type:complete len:199 (-),score=43.78 GHUV01020357.1:189-785(-)
MSRNYRGNFARPENALKRADELENVGQKLSALQQLHDVVTSKKHRTWSKTYEEIMFKLIDLCVEMKKRNHAKEALMQYRNMCQQVNINSLEEVIKYYLNKATEKAEEARQQAEVGAAAGHGCSDCSSVATVAVNIIGRRQSALVRATEAIQLSVRTRERHQHIELGSFFAVHVDACCRAWFRCGWRATDKIAAGSVCM